MLRSKKKANQNLVDKNVTFVERGIVSSLFLFVAGFVTMMLGALHLACFVVGVVVLIAALLLFTFAFTIASAIGMD